jgi:oligopeptide/dipeptide ABC transporter ATP-binding protein
MLLTVRDLVTLFKTRAGVVRAVDGVDLDLARAETLALVGESGSGKSTIGRSILRLVEPTSGDVHFDGTDVLHAGRRELHALRRRMQIVFQNPYTSLDPRMRVKEVVGEPLVVHRTGTRAEREARVVELLEQVELGARDAGRHPRELSGGQRQRVAIARALALEPSFVVCDEAVSALDVSIQAQILNLLNDLKADLGLAYLFISHDLAVVRHIADRVAVLYLGQVVELAPADALFASPSHPYTAALLSAAPGGGDAGRRERIVLRGDVPSPVDPPAGCRFHTRCWKAQANCRVDAPALTRTPAGRAVACHYPE